MRVVAIRISHAVGVCGCSTTKSLEMSTRCHLSMGLLLVMLLLLLLLHLLPMVMLLSSVA